MEPSLVIIGLNFRTAPVSVRERFVLSADRRAEALQRLVRSEGVDEVMVLQTCGRTEFVVWASDPAEGANSVLRFLTREFNLKLSEWSNFYRLVDDSALLHLFRVASGLDTVAMGDRVILDEISAARSMAQHAGTIARFLNAIIDKTLQVSHRVRTETVLAQISDSISLALVKIAAEVFTTLTSCRYSVLGDSNPVRAISDELAQAGVTELTGAGNLARLLTADIIVSASSGAMVSAPEMAATLSGRKGKPVVIVDLAVPRSFHHEVRQLSGVHLYNVDDLERVLQRTAERQDAQAQAEKIFTAEVQGFRQKLMQENVVPAIQALRHRLEELCGEELRTLEHEYGPFTEDQSQALHSLASHITQRIASSVARELNEMPEDGEPPMAEVLQRLFRLNPRDVVPALKH